MAARPEVLAQLARMLGDDALRSASDGAVQDAVDRGFDRLVRALVAETADSDDVFDRASALSYVDTRLTDLAAILTPDQLDRLARASKRAIAAW